MPDETDSHLLDLSLLNQLEVAWEAAGYIPPMTAVPPQDTSEAGGPYYSRVPLSQSGTPTYAITAAPRGSELAPTMTFTSQYNNGQEGTGERVTIERERKKQPLVYDEIIDKAEHLSNVADDYPRRRIRQVLSTHFSSGSREDHIKRTVFQWIFDDQSFDRIAAHLTDDNY